MKADGKLEGIYSFFLGAAYAYVDSKPSVSITNQEKYGEFVAEAKNRLLQALPDSIYKAHKEHVKLIDELLEKGYIERAGYEQSRHAYLLRLVDPVKNDKNPGPRAASNAFDKSGSEAPHLEKLLLMHCKKVSERTIKKTIPWKL